MQRSEGAVRNLVHRGLSRLALQLADSAATLTGTEPDRY
jgi:DNA-directed RNA polymerase specialized sigma24 family protein